MVLSILIPAYNEENTILKILQKVNSVKLPDNIEKQIIVINDGSTDNTLKLLEEHVKNTNNITILNNEKNSGKGASINNGIKHATGDFVVIQDADLECDPDEYVLLLKPILDGHADVVYGSRFIGGKPHRVMFFWHSFGNKTLTFLSNMFTNLNLTDMETCYKMFKSEFIKQIDIKEKRFGFEPEITAKISKIKNIRIYEVGISFYGRTYIEGKKINFKDGFKAIWCIIKYNLFA
ncbi:MAG: glycosyl transferase [Bacteroidetes bacterium GWA2_30_7]|nr:MAG: glycosyl transferase [Bacteroidetes bacterium GWA2_30_7]